MTDLENEALFNQKVQDSINFFQSTTPDGWAKYLDNILKNWQEAQALYDQNGDTSGIRMREWAVSELEIQVERNNDKKSPYYLAGQYWWDYVYSNRTDDPEENKRQITEWRQKTVEMLEEGVRRGDGDCATMLALINPLSFNEYGVEALDGSVDNMLDRLELAIKLGVDDVEELLDCAGQYGISLLEMGILNDGRFEALFENMLQMYGNRMIPNNRTTSSWDLYGVVGMTKAFPSHNHPERRDFFLAKEYLEQSVKNGSNMGKIYYGAMINTWLMEKREDFGHNFPNPADVLLEANRLLLEGYDEGGSIEGCQNLFSTIMTDFGLHGGIVWKYPGIKKFYEALEAESARNQMYTYMHASGHISRANQIAESEGEFGSVSEAVTYLKRAYDYALGNNEESLLKQIDYLTTNQKSILVTTACGRQIIDEFNRAKGQNVPAAATTETTPAPVPAKEPEIDQDEPVQDESSDVEEVAEPVVEEPKSTVAPLTTKKKSISEISSKFLKATKKYSTRLGIALALLPSRNMLLVIIGILWGGYNCFRLFKALQGSFALGLAVGRLNNEGADLILESKYTGIKLAERTKKRCLTSFAVTAVALLLLFMRAFGGVILFVILAAIIAAAIIYGWKFVANKILESVTEDEEMITKMMDDLR